MPDSSSDFQSTRVRIPDSQRAIQDYLWEQGWTDGLPVVPPTEERVLRMRFGIGMNNDHTLEEVGKQFDVTRERIRQIEARAMSKLRHPSSDTGARDLLAV